MSSSAAAPAPDGVRRRLNEIVCRLAITPQNYSLQAQLLDLLASHSWLRRPDLLASFGYKCAALHHDKLGDKVWELYEKVLKAALDVADLDTAEKCYRALKQRFPGSRRVLRLRIMMLECKGNYKEAVKLCDDLLAVAPADVRTWTRKVCCLRGCGRWNEAISELVKLVEVYAGDVGSWRELAELYTAQRQFHLAKFALEEVIMLAPGSYASYLEYAEVLYTLGDRRSIELARQYYAMSLELNSDNNARALYGVVLCVRSGKSGKKSLGEQLDVWSKDRLLRQYRAQAPALVPIVESFLSQD